MTSTIRTAAVFAAAAGLILGASACTPSPAPGATPSASADPAQLTGARAADTIRGFVAASTSDQVAADVAKQATAATFAPAVKLLDKGAPAATVQSTVTDFVLAKMADPKAPVTVAVDDAKVTVDGLEATVPVSAITVKAGDRKVPNSDTLAAEVNHLAFRDGAWVITFPPASSPSASPSTAPSK